MQITGTAKNAKLKIGWCMAKNMGERRALAKFLRRKAIYDVDSSGNSFRPMTERDMTERKDCAGHISNITMFAFSKTILCKSTRT